MEQLLLPIVMFGALGAMMFFGMRKQKRQVAETKSMQATLAPGARVLTTSGLHAMVTAVADDTIELEIAPGVRSTWVRAAVRQVVVAAPADPAFDGAHTVSGEDESAPGVNGAANGTNGAVNLDKSDVAANPVRKNAV